MLLATDNTRTASPPLSTILWPVPSKTVLAVIRSVLDKTIVPSQPNLIVPPLFDRCSQRRFITNRHGRGSGRGFLWQRQESEK